MGTIKYLIYYTRFVLFQTILAYCGPSNVEEALTRGFAFLKKINTKFNQKLCYIFQFCRARMFLFIKVAQLYFNGKTTSNLKY